MNALTNSANTKIIFHFSLSGWAGLPHHTTIVARTIHQVNPPRPSAFPPTYIGPWHRSWASEDVTSNASYRRR